MLPQARCESCIGHWCTSFKSFFVFPSFVNSTYITICWQLHSPTVIDLYFVSRLKINTGIGTFWNHKIKVEQKITVLHFCCEMVTFLKLDAPCIIIEKDGASFSGTQCSVAVTSLNSSNDFPIGRGCLKTF